MGIVEHAYENNALHRECCRENRFTLDHLERFDDIKRIPMVSKRRLRQYSLEERLVPQNGRI